MEIDPKQTSRGMPVKTDAYFRMLIEGVLDILTVSNRRGIYEYVSPSVEKTLGYAPAELIGKSLFALLHPADRLQAMKIFDLTILRAGQPQSAQVRHRHKDGSWRVLEAVGKFVRDESGSHFMINSRDITARLEVEKERAQLFAAIEHSADSIVITDVKGTIKYVNPAFERLTGYSGKEAIGKNPSLLKSGKHDGSFYERMWAILKSGKVWSGYLINKRKDGSIFEEDATITPVKDDNGEITHYVAVKRDMTERRHLEEVAQQSEKMAAIGQLAAGVAHELNNPLSVILGFAQSLVRRAARSEPASSPLLSIEREALRCRNLVQNLLMFSREHKPGFSPEDPVRMIQSALTLVETQTRVKKINIVTNFPAESPLVQMDGNQFQQVIINLCSNAIDAMPAGGTLTVGMRQAEKLVEIRVGDTGTGIPEEVRRKIWEPFFTTKEEGKGTGLGLSLVYEIVQKHNAKIELQSEKDKGTVFTILLPITQPDSSNTAKAA